MIILDTHMWMWWATSDPQIPKNYSDFLLQNEAQGLGVSVISCWEIAKLVEKGRINFSIDIAEWIDTALAIPNIHLIGLTPAIAVESTQLPGTFHRDPADQIIVATARIYDLPLMTVDRLIRAYPDVKLAP